MGVKGLVLGMGGGRAAKVCTTTLLGVVCNYAPMHPTKSPALALARRALPLQGVVCNHATHSGV